MHNIITVSQDRSNTNIIHYYNDIIFLQYGQQETVREFENERTGGIEIHIGQ